MTNRPSPRCPACALQDAIDAAPHDPGCRCYGGAYVIGFIEAVAALLSGEQPAFCDHCAAIAVEEAKSRGLRVEPRRVNAPANRLDKGRPS